MCNKHAFFEVGKSKSLGVTYVTYKCSKCGYTETYRVR